MYAQYENNAKQLDSYDRQIAQLEQISSLMGMYSENLLNGTMTLSEVKKLFDNTMKMASGGFTSAENLSAILSVFEESSVASALKGTTTELAGVKSDFKSALTTANTYLKDVAEYKGTWEDISTNVKKLLDELERLAKEEAKKVKAAAKAEVKATKNTGGGGGGGGSNNHSYIVQNSDGTWSYSNSDGTVKGTTGNLSEANDKMKMHSGIKQGLVGEIGDDEKAKILKTLSLEKLKPGEVPKILQIGEAVLTKDQQSMLLKNIGNALLNQALGAINIGEYNNNFTFGNITITEAQNVTDIAKGIMNGGLTQAMNQALFKHK